MKKGNEELVNTKRLSLRAMTDTETERLIDSCADEELCEAYREMLSGSRENANNRIWYAPWSIVRKSDGEFIGDIEFKGAAVNGAVEIGYGVEAEYEGRGYATEALRGMCAWAFEQSGVTLVEAETAPDNAASRRVLEKCGFVPNGEGKEGPRFALKKECTCL